MRHSKIKTTIIKTLIFISISAFLIVLTDLLILDSKRSIWRLTNSYLYDGSNIDVYALRKQHKSYMNDGIYIESGMVVSVHNNNIIDSPPSIAEFEQDIVIIGEDIKDTEIIELANIEPAIGVYNEPEIEIFTGIEPEIPNVDIAAKIEGITTAETKGNNSYTEPKGKGMVVIIIDDMGVNLRSKQVEVLSGPLTLSYLPYADNLEERTKRASANGHELMLHMPMEPMNGKMDGGPKVLSSSLGDAEFIEVLEWGLSSFEGFVGLNNHMGSRLTKDQDSMQRVMEHLKDKDLFFIDSRTIGSSVAATTAHSNGIPYAERDVFIDHEINMDFLRSSLKKLEDVANDKGYAIAIGHPHKETIAALKEWLPTLEGKGLTLVPVSRVIKYPVAAEAVAAN